MSNLFRNKYRIPSARLEGFDYGSNAAYFVTICTKDKEHFFGEIVGLAGNANSTQTMFAAETQGIASLRSADVRLSVIGEIVEREWLKTQGLRPDMNLELGVFVIMPNHFHAILIIGENPYNTNQNLKLRRDAMPCVSAATMDAVNDSAMLNSTTNNSMQNTASNKSSKTQYKNKFAPQSKNLAAIIRGFKAAVTMQAKNLDYHHFAWQTRFHEHVIRDAREFENIQDYIINNPATWLQDSLYTKP